jgi:dihydroflavonol-4-reductase
MARALVTGANGHLGCNLVRDLLEHGYDVVPFVREGANVTGLDGLGLELARGDVLDSTSVERAVDGCEVVFHAGTPYLVWAKDPATIVEPALRGTENVLRAAKANGVRRVVVTSSCNAVGFTTDPAKLLDETSWNERAKSPYIRAKNEQERRAHALAKELDLDVVTVLPTTVLGWYDYRKTPTTAPFVDALAHKGPVPFPMNLVDVRDVARVHVLAAEKGEQGERYLAGGENVDVPTLAGLIEKHVGRRPAEGLPPAWVLRVVAFVSEAVSSISGKAPLITGDLLDDVGGGVPLFDCHKARDRLGFVPRTPEVVIVETLRWALFMGWLPAKLAASLREKNPPEAAWGSRPGPAAG